MPKFQIHRKAATDLLEIGNFTIERWSMEQADRYLTGLKALFHLLAASPLMGRSAANLRQNLRRFEYQSHIVFYQIVSDGIEIKRVLHKNRALKKKDFETEKGPTKRQGLL